MKKLIFSAAVMASAFFAASCQQELLEPQAEGNTVTYTVEVPEVATKAIGDEITDVDKVYFEVYRAADVNDLSKSPVFEGSKPVIENRSSFSLEFIKNQEFVVLFWAQNSALVNTDVTSDAGMYNINDLRAIKLVNPGASNNAAAQVFAGKDTVSDCVSATKGKVTLTRPVSQINVYTTTESLSFGDITIGLDKSSMTVAGLYNTYNVAAGDAVVADENLATFAYSETAVPTATADNTDLTYVAMNYVGFAPQRGTNVNVDFTIKTSEANPIMHSVSNVPVKPNYRTNIIGNLLTSDVDYNVTLDKEWGSEETKYEYVVLDGVNYISIATAKDLKYFADQVNAGDPEWINANILLANDIDLSELVQTRSTTSNWTPISMSTDLANGQTYRGIFNGNGKSIKNMVCEGTEVAGLFGYLYAATIKNVTIENATIKSNHYAAGIVAWVNNLKGNIQMPFVIENCHVVNSTITSTPEQVNGEWDNGDKVGGLVGAAWFNQGSGLNVGTKIANCSVENTTIKAYRDFGGFVGYAQGVNIENCSTTDVTLEQDLTHDYKAPDTPDTFGLTIGKNAGGNTIDGNEFVADGVTTDADGNYHILNAAGLKWVSTNVNTMEYYVNQSANIFDNKTVYLEADIDLNGAEWRPIGDYAFSRTSFNGVFDGQNHTISNFKVTNPVSWTEKVTEASYGFFGNVKGTVKNLTIKKATVTPEGGRYSAALVGRLHNGGTIENCHVEESSVTINHWQVGGLVGQNNNGNILNCSVTGSTITGKAAVGAIVGMDMAAGEHIIENCRVTNSALAAETIFEGYEMTYGLAVGLVNASGIILNLNNVVVENNTIKGVAANTLVGEVVEGAKVYVNGSIPVTTAAQLEAAIKAGGECILMNDVAMTQTIAISNANFVLDGNGKTITMTEGATNTYALFDITGGKAAFKNVTFDGVKSGAVVRTVGVDFDAENVTAQNGQHTQVQGLFRLMGKSTIKNCTFKNNTCSMVITLNYDGANNDPQVVENCVFESNTCNGTGVLYYVKGSGATINANKFIKNTSTVTESDNAATLYMGFTENNVITNNVFQNNTVNVGTSKRVAGGLMIGYDAVITGNTFVGNTVNGENAKGNDVCASVYYTDINLSGNYWGGGAPVENDDYYKEYNNHEVIINDYLTENPIK